MDIKNGRRQKDKAVFLDKDGTLIENVPYNVDPGQIRLLPGTLTGLKAMHRAGYRLVIITNQSGVARGYFEASDLDRVEANLRGILAEAAIPLAGFFYCPHHPQGVVPDYAVACDCRKPAPGLLLEAAEVLNVDCSRSWFIGDILDDVEAGRRAGCRTILLDTGGETEWALSPGRLPHHIAHALPEAARIICAVGQSNPEVLCAD